MSVLDTGSKFSSFIINAGDMFHIDSGSLHHIENIGEDVAERMPLAKISRSEHGAASLIPQTIRALFGITEGCLSLA